jgi:hypothetical protein
MCDSYMNNSYYFYHNLLGFLIIFSIFEVLTLKTFYERNNIRLHNRYL